MQNTCVIKVKAPETRNGLNQMIRMDKSTDQKLLGWRLKPSAFFPQTKQMQMDSGKIVYQLQLSEPHVTRKFHTRFKARRCMLRLWRLPAVNVAKEVLRIEVIKPYLLIYIYWKNKSLSMKFKLLCNMLRYSLICIADRFQFSSFVTEIFRTSNIIPMRKSLNLCSFGYALSPSIRNNNFKIHVAQRNKMLPSGHMT